MDQKFLWKPSAMALVLIILLGLNWTACATVKRRHTDSDWVTYTRVEGDWLTTINHLGHIDPVWVTYTGVGSYYFFDDIHVPKALNYKASKSFIYETPQSRAVSLVFSAWGVDIEFLINFFTNNMEKDNWKLMNNSFKGKEYVLNFSKPKKTCIIGIVDKWYGSVEVEIRVGQIQSQIITPHLSVSSPLPFSPIAKVEEVTQFFDNYINLYARKDIDGFLSLFSSKAIQNQKDRIEEIMKIYTDFFNQSFELRYRMEGSMKIYENAVEVKALYEIDQLNKRGQKNVWTGSIRWVLTREDGVLKIVSVDYQRNKSQ